MRRPKGDWTITAIVLIALACSLAVSAIPGWIRYSGEMAMAAALASVGVMLLLRAGLLSFGQGLFYFVGAYAVAFLNKHLGVTDAAVMVLVGAAAAGIVACALGFFIARYRGIFFSMLTLAISMVVYGIAVKFSVFGGSDGFNVGAISFFGLHPRGLGLQTSNFLLCLWMCAIFTIGAHVLWRSRLGKVLEAVSDNEVRLEFLGASVRDAVHIAYGAAGVLAGAAGALAGIAARHVDPSFAYWTTAGDFIFIVLLGGQAGVLSPFLGSFALETFRSFASASFPDEWQLALGSVMLAIVLFLPRGLDSVFVSLWRTLKPPKAKSEHDAIAGIVKP